MSRMPWRSANTLPHRAAVRLPSAPPLMILYVLKLSDRSLDSIPELVQIGAESGSQINSVNHKGL